MLDRGVCPTLVAKIMICKRFSLFLALFMAALCNRAGHYIFCPVVSSIFLSLLFSPPSLSGRRLDVYYTSTHGVALVRI